jgi:poly-beta-hydroxybutyrate-responsive repressor
MAAGEKAEMGQHSNGGQPKNFIRPCLLLLLKESPSHGYELLDRLAQFRIPRDHGALYRTLRTLEQEGLVHSGWEAHGRRPDRRRYEVTPDGEMWLDGWAAALQETQRVLAGYLRRYRKLRRPSSAAAGSVADTGRSPVRGGWSAAVSAAAVEESLSR